MDPCWLPSAIMQTTGAMVGIYLAIYILALPKLIELAPLFKLRAFITPNRERKKQATRGYIAKLLLTCVSMVFSVIIVTSCCIIYFSMLWLESLKTNTPIITYFGIPVDNAVKTLFVISLIAIVIWSILINVVVLYLSYTTEYDKRFQRFFVKELIKTFDIIKEAEQVIKETDALIEVYEKRKDAF
ncbi:MAG: hypothetical protein JW878_04180 [Methanomicrobia archaeon]|nr:hypothetical protein [Methanomicrobia archaeon]